MQFGLDLSHHQNPAMLPWARFNGVVDFVICRSSYGSKLRDRHVAEHIIRARAINAQVGLYYFFRPSQDVRAQWDMLRSVAETVGIGAGDLVPAIDIEKDPSPGRDVAPSWSGPCLELCELVREHFGDCIVYITQREWKMLGSPAWVLDRPLWVAHYTNAPKPASPGNVEPTIWQYRVGPFDPNGPGGYDKQSPLLDHNRALKPLPLIGEPSDAGIEEELDRATLDQDDVTIIEAQVAEGIDDLKREYFDQNKNQEPTT